MILKFIRGHNDDLILWLNTTWNFDLYERDVMKQRVQRP